MTCRRATTVLRMTLSLWAWHTAGVCAEQAAELQQKGQAALVESQTNPRAIATAARCFALASAAYETEGQAESVLEMNACLYWCKKKMTPADLNSFLESADAVALGRLNDVDARKAPPEEAQGWYDRAAAFERKVPQQHLRVAIRYFEVADRFKGTDASLRAQERSLHELQLAAGGQTAAPKANEGAPAAPTSAAAKPVVPVAPPAEKPVAKVPVPDKAAIAQTEKVVKDLFKAEYADARPVGRQALAQKFLQEATSAGNDPSARYVLLREAAALGAPSGDLPTALKAVDELGKYFVLDVPGLKLEVFGKAAQAPPSTELNRAIADGCLAACEEPAADDNYDLALRLLVLAESAAAKSGDINLTALVQAKSKETREEQAEFAKVKAAQNTLRAKPDDPEANLAVGRFYCLTKGQWERGLPLLAKGSDKALSEKAVQDLLRPEDAAARLALAEGWWGLAEKAAPAAKRQFMARAVLWYYKMLPGTAGLARLKIQKRLAEARAAGAGEAGNMLDLGGGVRMELIFVSAGAYPRGGRGGREITLTQPYYMGKFLVTQDQWEAVSGTHRSHNKGANLPVDSISWEEVRAFCGQLSKMTGRTVRLPTEAEWEYACRAGTKTEYFFGGRASDLDNYAWHAENSGENTHPVGRKKPNPWGFYDIYGNVWEWCLDWYDVKYYAFGPRVDPPGPAEGTLRVLRGGSYHTDSGYMLGGRWYEDPSRRHSDAGFRVVVEMVKP